MSAMRASREPSKLPKSPSFRGLCPLDPRRGFAPGPHQGPLSGPLDPTPLYVPLASLTLVNIFFNILSDQCFWRCYAPAYEYIVVTLCLVTMMPYFVFSNHTKSGKRQKNKSPRLPAHSLFYFDSPSLISVKNQNNSYLIISTQTDH